jgi:Xaa-Pro aminopeptidase
MTMREALRRRVAALRRLCRARGVGAVLLTDRHSVRYFSGFTGEDSFLLVGRRWARLLTDGRFSEQARIECPHVRTITRSGRMIDAIAAALAGRKVRRVGIEGSHVSVSLKAGLDRALGKSRTKPFGGQIDALREVKDAVELKAIRKAVRVAEGAFRALTAGGRRKFVGRSEREVAGELEYLMRMRGADRAAFETIVAAGAHSALPHYRPGGTRIRRGDVVLIDWGAVVGGYCSDLTRVVFTGRIPPQIARVYEIVLRAQSAGLAAVRPGASCESADAAAREVIAGEGYGEALAHGLGHGIGLDVHEGPRLGSRARGPLRAGMVVTVEPGVYLPGVGGVRIEDDVRVGPEGGRRLGRHASWRPWCFDRPTRKKGRPWTSSKSESWSG